MGCIAQENMIYQALIVFISGISGVDLALHKGSASMFFLGLNIDIKYK